MRLSLGTSGSAAVPSVPRAVVTFTDAPARSVMPTVGRRTRDDFTSAEPPPVIFAWSPAASPMSATSATPVNGSTPPAFFRRTAPCSTMARASCWCSGLVTTASGLPTAGRSNIPARNIVVRMRVTFSSSTLAGTRPFPIACLSASPKYSGKRPNALAPPGISMSRPAFAAASVLCVANQSDITKPS